MERICKVDVWLKWLLCFVFFAQIISVNAQGQQIRGQLLDENTGRPLEGVSVLIDGVALTRTDLAGKFVLNNIEIGKPISFQLLGYANKSSVTTSDMTVMMTEESDLIDEVVVVGYGTQRKETLTGSITQLNGPEVLQGRATTNIAAAIQGQVPGLAITRNSSRPGNEGINVTLRGGVSVNDKGLPPMILIDGVEAAMWEFSQINPNDVENISVLKDAAASIYGTRAAGGVILVTTKRAKAGDVKLNYSGATNLNFIGNRFPLASGSQWGQMMVEAIENDSRDEGGFKRWWMFSEDQFGKIINNEAFVEVINLGNGYLTHIDPLNANQFDAIYGSTWGNQQNVTLSGGSEKLRGYGSIGYANDRSLVDVVYDGTKKYNFRTNVDYEVREWISLKTNVSFDRRVVSTPMQGVGQGVQDFYVFPLYNDKGQYYDVFGANNVLARLNEGGRRNNRDDIFRLGADLKFDLDRITPGLSVNGNANIRNLENFLVERQTTVTMYDWDGELNLANNIYFQTPAQDRFAKNVRQSQLYKVFGGFANYSRSFNNHNITALSGVTYEHNDFSKLEGLRRNMADDHLDDINTGDVATMEAYGGSNQFALVSFLSRLNYDYKGIYLVEGIFRRDGSSRLHPDYRWGNFVGLSGGVRVSEYDFIKNWGVFDELKLRGSYGETGSLSGLTNYDYISNIAFGTTIFGPVGTRYNSARIANLTTFLRSWERVATTNVAVDFSVLERRLSGTLEWFYRKNKGMLVDITYPQVLGATAPKTNDGNFLSKGWEVTLNWRDKIGEVGYRIGLNVSDARTEVTNYPFRIAVQAGSNSSVEGKPVNALYVFKTDGYFQTTEEVQSYYDTHSGSGSMVPRNVDGTRLTPGSLKKVDLNGDGAITMDDLYYYGDANPHYLMGVNLGANYKGFDFTMFFQGVGQQYLIRTGHLAYPFSAGWTNQNASFIGQTWSESNPNATYPVMSRVGARNNWNYRQYSDANITNAWYIRAKSVVLGYRLSPEFSNRIGIAGLRIWASGDNLFEFSNIKDGFDPETRTDVGQGTLDVFSRTVSFGLDVTF